MNTSKISAFAARLAIAASAAGWVLLLSLHVLSPEYSPAWRLISEYANGSYAWVLSLMFAAYGLSSLSLVFAIRSLATTRRARIGLVLLAVAGAGQVAAGPFDLNQVAPHELAGVLGIFGLPIAAVLLTPTLAHSKSVALTARLTWVSTVVWIVSFIPMIATFWLALGGALPTTPPETLPPGVIAVVGWTNRLLVLSASAWVVTVALVALGVEPTRAARGSFDSSTIVRSKMRHLTARGPRGYVAASERDLFRPSAGTGVRKEGHDDATHSLSDAGSAPAAWSA